MDGQMYEELMQGTGLGAGERTRWTQAHEAQAESQEGPSERRHQGVHAARTGTAREKPPEDEPRGLEVSGGTTSQLQTNPAQRAQTWQRQQEAAFFFKSFFIFQL